MVGVLLLARSREGTAEPQGPGPEASRRASAPPRRAEREVGVR